MIRKIQRKYFEIWGEVEAQNNLLKIVLLSVSLLTLPLLVAVLVLALKNPPTVIIDPEVSLMIKPMEPPAKMIEKEISRAVLRYLKMRHNWQAETIRSGTAFVAQNLVASGYREKFLLSAQEEIKVAEEKKLSQKFYPDEPEISQADSKASVRGERILIVNGIRASQPLNLELKFSDGARIKNNPEGIYVTDEKLISKQ